MTFSLPCHISFDAVRSRLHEDFSPLGSPGNRSGYGTSIMTSMTSQSVSRISPYGLCEGITDGLGFSLLALNFGQRDQMHLTETLDDPESLELLLRASCPSLDNVQPLIGGAHGKRGERHEKDERKHRFTFPSALSLSLSLSLCSHLRKEKNRHFGLAL